MTRFNIIFFWRLMNVMVDRRKFVASLLSHFGLQVCLIGVFWGHLWRYIIERCWNLLINYLILKQRLWILFLCYFRFFFRIEREIKLLRLFNCIIFVHLIWFLFTNRGLNWTLPIHRHVSSTWKWLQFLLRIIPSLELTKPYEVTCFVTLIFLLDFVRDILNLRHDCWVCVFPLIFVSILI